MGYCIYILVCQKIFLTFHLFVFTHLNILLIWVCSYVYETVSLVDWVGYKNVYKHCMTLVYLKKHLQTIEYAIENKGIFIYVFKTIDYFVSLNHFFFNFLMYYLINVAVVKWNSLLNYAYFFKFTHRDQQLYFNNIDYSQLQN